MKLSNESLKNIIKSLSLDPDKTWTVGARSIVPLLEELIELREFKSAREALE